MFQAACDDPLLKRGIKAGTQVACEPSVRDFGGKRLGRQEGGGCYGAAREGERGKEHE